MSAVVLRPYAGGSGYDLPSHFKNPKQLIMLVVGAKGFAKEILEILIQNNIKNIHFYDDINKDVPKKLFDIFPILVNEDEAKKYFENISEKFTIGIGNPQLRKKVYEKMVSVGGKFTSAISSYSEFGSYEVKIGDGCNILSGVKISNDVKIGKGCIIYYNSVITHDVEIGDFCEISPSVNILGRAKIGNNCQLATGSIIFPDVTIGNNVVIAAGAVVRENIPDNVMAAGIPAIVKKHF